MTSINEELEAANAAKGAINLLLKETPKSAVAAALKKAKEIAILSLASEGALNDARANVGIAVSSLFYGPPTQGKIDKANRAIENWINQLHRNLSLAATLRAAPSD
jgi:hypothetical protein